MLLLCVREPRNVKIVQKLARYVHYEYIGMAEKNVWGRFLINKFRLLQNRVNIMIISI